MSHLLVTNDYPPKVGGIQSYLYELWQRIPSDRFTVLTIDHPDAPLFDALAPHSILRLPHKVLLPTPSIVHQIRTHAKRCGASLVVLDPIFPLGAVGPWLGMPYAVVLHGAEVAIAARMPAVRDLVVHSIRGASLIIAAGSYPEREANRVMRGRLPTTVVVPPGVDSTRFHPIERAERLVARERFGLNGDSCVVASVSRLVPRKGMDVLIEAAARLASSRPDLVVLIGGSGRDERRLRALIERTRAPVQLVGRIADDELASFYAMADVFAMLARNRWLGLEQEGFGIVYLEAAACGVAQLAGLSGGTFDAVVDGTTGIVVDRPADVVVAADALGRLVDDEQLRVGFGRAARERAQSLFDYEVLAARLDEALAAAGG